MNVKFEFRESRGPFCCGAGEIGGFYLEMDLKTVEIEIGFGSGPYKTIEPDHKKHDLYFSKGLAAFSEEEQAEIRKATAKAFKKAIHSAKEHLATVQIWFAKSPRNSVWEHEALLELVQQQHGVIYLGMYRNRNSGNDICGYLIPLKKRLDV